MPRLEKRSVTIDGHRTSIALEPEFWAALAAAAARSGVSLTALIEQIDAERAQTAPARGLASALRVYALAAQRL